jgi:hypothetical protein
MPMSSTEAFAVSSVVETQAPGVRTAGLHTLPANRQALVGSALTVVVPIPASSVPKLEALLDDIGTHIANNRYIDFSRLTLTHFLRWVILPPMDAGSAWQLAFESNHDGSVEEHLGELLHVAPGLLHALYAPCGEYPLERAAESLAAVESVTSFLLAHAQPYAAFYVGVPGASVQQIRAEAAVRSWLQQRMDRNTTRDPLVLARDVLRELSRDPVLASVVAAADDKFPLRPLRLLQGAGVALAALPLLGPALLAICLKELSDPESPELAIPDAARALMAREDLQIQNQLTHVVAVRPGWLRSLSVDVVLGTIDFLAQELFKFGNLGGISTIHFARWVRIDGGKRLLFFSNYDGSWESYLGDFVDKAAVGLTAVWSNTEGFPRTLLLLFKGARDEERFKAWTRQHQVPTQLWYSAYPQLTVKNIVNNRKICAQLRKGFRSRRVAERWLARL